MALSPEKIKEMRTLAGVSPDLPSAPPNKDSVIQQRLAEFDSATAPSIPAAPKPNLGERLGQDFMKRGEEAQRIISTPSEGNALARGVKAAAQGAGAITDIATETIKSGWDILPKFLTKNFFNEGPDSFKGKQKESEDTEPNKVEQAFYDWTVAHPEAANKLKNTLEAVQGAGEIAGTVAGAGESATMAGKVPTLKQTGQEFIKDTAKIDSKLGSIRGNVSANNVQKEFNSIQDKIMPKPTVKEGKLAQSQGRLIKGKKPTLFRSGTPDEVLPTKDTQRAIGTIHREIPGASKMDETTLYDALDTKITEKAQSLQPQLKETPIKPKTIEKINNDWKALKEKQIKNADATEEANVRKIQQQFEERLQKTDSDNLDDLWQSSKDYDASVPENVKKANSLSSESLQNKKEIWLQNRAILRKAITDSSSGLGAESKAAFDSMHDMYNAKENLLSKAKIETKTQPSKIRQVINKYPVASGAIGGSTLYATGKNLGLPLP